MILFQGFEPPVRKQISLAVWAWFNANQEMVIFEKKIFKLITITFRVKHLRELFERLFGRETFAFE